MDRKRINWIFGFTFILLLLIGIGLRFHGLTIQSYWMDELHSASYANPYQPLSAVIARTSHDAHPPLYHILLWTTYRVFGYSELTGRALSAVLGVLGLIAIFMLGMALWNKKVGLFALAVTSPLFFHVYYSQEVRAYALLFLMTTLSWWSVVNLLKRPCLFRAIVYAGTSCALIYTHYFGFFVLISQAIYMSFLLIWKGKSFLKVYLYAVISGGIVILCFLPWMPCFLGNYMLRSTWIKPVYVNFVSDFIARYFLTGGKVLWISVPLIVFLAWLQPQRKEGNREEFEILPYFLLLIWIVITYGLPFILSLLKVPMLIPRVTIITLPAIILLISGTAANLKTKYLIPISLLTCVSMAIILVFTNRYYNYKWKENWRGVVQYVMKRDPAGKDMIYSDRYTLYFRAYFLLFGDKRTIQNSRFLKSHPQELLKNSIDDGFWFLDAHDMKGPNPWMSNLLTKYFKSIDAVRFRHASGLFFRYKSLNAKAALIGGTAFPKNGTFQLSVLKGNFQKLPDDAIRLCSNGSVTSCPFIFPEGSYRVRILARGDRVEGETARFRLSIGQQTVMTEYTKEESSWHEGKLKIENADVLPVTISFLNDYFEKIKPDTPLNPGSVIKLMEGDWNGTLTRIGTTNDYAARWKNETTGELVSDTVRVRKFTPDSIVLYRESLKGYYRGNLAPDGKSATGTADWYKSNGKWKAVFPDMKFTGTLDRNLDILQIKIVSIPFRSEHRRQKTEDRTLPFTM